MSAGDANEPPSRSTGTEHTRLGGHAYAPPAAGDPTSQTREWTMSPGQCLNLRMEVEHMQHECHNKGAQAAIGTSSNCSRPMDAKKENGPDNSPPSPRSPIEAASDRPRDVPVEARGSPKGDEKGTKRTAGESGIGQDGPKTPSRPWGRVSAGTAEVIIEDTQDTEPE